MRNSLGPDFVPDPSDEASASVSGTPAAGEIVIPHVANAGPVTAVRNFVIQSSLAQLKANGHYDKYVSLIAPSMLAQLLEAIGPGWLPVESALAHYEACEKMMLGPAQRAEMASQVGDRLQETTLVSSAKRARDANFNLWNAVGALHRMWARMYQGGSVQMVKLGKREMQMETLGFPQNRFRYFRQGQLDVIVASYGAVGARDISIRVVRYTPHSHELIIRLRWT